MRMASDGLCSGSVKSSSPRAGDPSRPSPSLAWSSVVHLQRSVEQDIKTDSLASSQPNRLRGDDRWEPLPKVSADDSCPFQLPPRPVFGHTTSSVLTLPLICLSHARDRLPMGLQSSVPPHAVLLVRPDGKLSGAVSSVTAGTDGRSSPRAETQYPFVPAASPSANSTLDTSPNGTHAESSAQGAHSSVALMVSPPAVGDFPPVDA